MIVFVEDDFGVVADCTGTVDAPDGDSRRPTCEFWTTKDGGRAVTVYVKGRYDGTQAQP